MSVKIRIAFYIYFVLCMVVVVIGIVDLSIPTIMPYHMEILGVDWGELDDGVRLLLRNFFIMSGASFLVSGITALIILFIPFRKGETWARFALPFPLFLFNIFELVLGIRVSLKTGVATPWPAGVVTMVMLLTAVLLTLLPAKGKAEEP